MNKGQILILALIGVVLLSSPALLGGSGLSLPKFSLAPQTGFTTLSLTGGSAVDDNLMLFWAADGSGGYARGEFSPAEVRALTGFLPANSFEMRINNTDQACRYQFRSDGKVIKRVDAWTIGIYKSTSGSYKCTGPNGEARCGVGATCTTAGQCIYPDTNGNYPNCQVQCSKLTDVGTVYKVDSFPINEFKLDVSLINDGKEYKTTLSNEVKEGTTDGVTHKYIGGFKGDMDCGTVSADVVAYLPKGSNTFQIKDAYTFNQLISQEPAPVSAYAAAAGYNSILSSFLGSTGQIGQLCTLENAQALNTASIRCKPTGSIIVPSGITTLPTSIIKVVIPSSTWEIGNVAASQATAAQLTPISVEVKNTGGTTASVDVCVRGPVDVSPICTRANIGASQTQTVIVNYQGAGLIDTFAVTVTDVNSPTSTASKTLQLKIDPFCQVTAPGASFQKVSTNFGCAFWCGDLIFQQDLMSSSCEPIADYERCEVRENGTCRSKMNVEGYHCTGIGTYTSANAYLDKVDSGGDKFIPERKEHQYFLTNYDNKMICDYVWEFGWGPDGSLSSARADYSLQPDYAQFVTMESTAPLASSDSITQAGDQLSTTVKTATGLDCAGPTLILIAIGIGVGFYLWRGRR